LAQLDRPTIRQRLFVGKPVLRDSCTVAVQLSRAGRALWEVLGNIANLIFVGGISLLLLMLFDDPRSGVGRFGELAAVATLGLSGPLIVFFVPWFIWRWRPCRRSIAKDVYLIGALIWMDPSDTSN
jgi:hypothetical protein